MGDLLFLEDYLAEPELVAEKSEEGLSDILNSPLSSPTVKENSPVKVNLGEKAEQSIEDAKAKSGGKSILQTASGAKKNTEKVLGAAVPSIYDLPTPPTGGIGLLLFIALLMVFAITPANSEGKTRLSLLWGAILGNYSLGDSTGGASDTSAAPSVSVAPVNLSYIQGGIY